MGLSSLEAQARLEQAGPNELETEAAVPAWRRLLGQFKDALVLLLVAAAVISCAVWAVERDTSLPYEGLVIITIVLLNAILGFVQEGRAEEALAALRAMAAPEASVVRDGEQRRLATRELVPGDLLIINEGDTVSADARLIDVVELQTSGGFAHRREPASAEKPGARGSRRRNRRPPQHGLRRHDRQLWARPRHRDGHRHGHRTGQDCRHVDGQRNPRQRRCSANSTVLASNWGSRSSSSRRLLSQLFFASTARAMRKQLSRC